MKKYQIDLHIKLQDLYDEYITSWQIGDRFIPRYTKVKNVLICSEVYEGAPISNGMRYPERNIIRIPETIDPVYPERSLWFMLNDTGKKTIIDRYQNLLEFLNEPDVTISILKALYVQWLLIIGDKK